MAVKSATCCAVEGAAQGCSQMEGANLLAACSGTDKGVRKLKVVRSRSGIVGTGGYPPILRQDREGCFASRNGQTALTRLRAAYSELTPRSGYDGQGASLGLHEMFSHSNVADENLAPD